MEADILAFAQQVCTEAYVDGKVESAAASLWGYQIVASVIGAILFLAIVALLAFCTSDCKVSKASVLESSAAWVALLAFALEIIVLALMGETYQGLLAWQSDPVSEVAKSIALSI